MRPTNALTDETQTSNGNIEHKQREHCNANSVAHHPRATQDADPCGQRPCQQDEIDGYPGDGRETESTQKRSKDQREKRVADDADRLEEGAGSLVSKAQQ